MKHKLIALAGLLLSPSVFIGQRASSTFGTTGVASSGQTESQPATVYIPGPEGLACPVGLQAKQGGATGLVKVRHAPDAQPEALAKPGQHIQLIITSPADKSFAPKVKGATVTARGLSARARIDKASGTGPADMRRTLNVTFTAEGDHSLTAELVLPGFTAVRSIKIEALEYADGSTRDFSGKKLCTVEPDPLMLIAGR
jgi:hypothetical protein